MSLDVRKGAHAGRELLEVEQRDVTTLDGSLHDTQQHHAAHGSVAARVAVVGDRPVASNGQHIQADRYRTIDQLASGMPHELAVYRVGIDMVVKVSAQHRSLP